ncbi:uncharacterized protein LOC134668657 [Cydia fagiglandana]|uniref:uncharacterized protein LOC134668657 n=1 Tax=Cydia fagiglandana TaxID=1458189 RepID=UPI002FEE1C9F
MQALRSEVAGLKGEVLSMKESMDFMNIKFEEMKTEAKDKFEICTQLQKEVETLKNDNLELVNRLNEFEQHSRACNIEIQCVPEHRSENLITTILQLAKTVSCDIKAEDIHHCTRTAKLDGNSSRPRNIVAKLKSPHMRDTLLASVIKFNKTDKDNKLNSSHLGLGGDKKPVYVAEHLTAYNKKLHKEARLAAKDKQYKYVWVRSGRILVRKDDKAQAIVLKSLDSIKRL